MARAAPGWGSKLMSLESNGERAHLSEKKVRGMVVRLGFPTIHTVNSFESEHDVLAMIISVEFDHISRELPSGMVTPLSVEAPSNSRGNPTRDKGGVYRSESPY